LAFARDTREIATAWLRYHQDVVRHTSEAGQAMLHARTFNEVQEAQAKLLRGTAQSFRDRTTKIAETVGRMATRLYDAPEEAGVKDGAGASV
jgi:acyl-CoA synthetase (NDP forming)